MKKTAILIFSLLTVSVLFTPFASVHAEDTTGTPTPTVTATPTTTQGPIRTRLEEARIALLNRAKTLAAKLFDNQFLTKLNSLRARVSANTTLGNDAKQTILAKIDSEITWFTQQKESISNATTIEQVRSIVKTARTRFLQVAKEVRRLHIAHGFVTVLDKIVTNLDTAIIPKIETKLAQLLAADVDVTVEQGLLTKAKNEVAAAKTDITEIRNSTTYEIAKKNYDEARTHLKNARNDLANLLKSLKLKI